MRHISDDERRARLARRHGLAEPGGGVAEAARSVVALHATEPANVYLAAHARSGASRDQVSQALYGERSVVRQLAMRRTVFAAPADLLPALWGSASARVHQQLWRRFAKEAGELGLAEPGAGEDWLSRVLDDVRLALAEGPATTAELRERLPELSRRLTLAPGTKYGTEVPVASRVLGVLASSGEVLRGDNAAGWRVSRPRWTLREHWLPGAPAALPARAGYAELVRRWLGAFGPGTEDDLVWWLGSTRGAVRSALADVGAVQVTVTADVGEAPAWVLEDDQDPVPAPEPWAALLPVLDPTVMGWKERSFYLGRHRDPLFDRNGNAGTTAWWSGRVIGGWHQDPDGVVHVDLLQDPGAVGRAALEAQAARLTQWLDGEVVGSTYHSPWTRERMRAHA